MSRNLQECSPQVARGSVMSQSPQLLKMFRWTRLVVAVLVLGVMLSPLGTQPASAAVERIASASSVTGGRNITIRIELDQPAYAGGFFVQLFTSSPLIPVPGFIVVPGGQSSASFTVKTGTTSVDTRVTVSAKSGGTTTSKAITVRKPYLYSLVVQSSYPEGVDGKFTAKISGPAPSGGATIYFNSNRPSILTVPSSVKIPAGYTSVTITVGPKMVPYNVAVNLSASYSGIKITKATTVTNT